MGIFRGKMWGDESKARQSPRGTEWSPKGRKGIGQIWPGRRAGKGAADIALKTPKKAANAWGPRGATLKN